MNQELQEPAPPVPEGLSIDDALWDKRHDILTKAWANIRYHARREHHYDLVDKFFKVVSVVIGGVLMRELGSSFVPFLGTVVAAFAVLDLIFGFADKRNVHRELKRRSTELVESIESVPIDAITTVNSAAWGAGYAKITADSPPTIKDLKLICEREQAIANGQKVWADKHIPELRWWRRWWAQAW